MLSSYAVVHSTPYTILFHSASIDFPTLNIHWSFPYSTSIRISLHSETTTNLVSTDFGSQLDIWRKLSLLDNNVKILKNWPCIFIHADLSFLVLTYCGAWCKIKHWISVPLTFFYLVGWSVTTWPFRWSDPSIGCATSVCSFSCSTYLSSDVFNINLWFSFVELRDGYLLLGQAILVDVSYL